MTDCDLAEDIDGFTGVEPYTESAFMQSLFEIAPWRDSDCALQTLHLSAWPDVNISSWCRVIMFVIAACASSMAMKENARHVQGRIQKLSVDGDDGDLEGSPYRPYSQFHVHVRT